MHRLWLAGKEVLRARAAQGPQHTRTELDAGKFLYRLVRFGTYREQRVASGWHAQSEIEIQCDVVPIP
jgi:hypothetical protein